MGTPLNENNIVEFQTIKPDPFKKLFESLKEVIVDVNLVFDLDGLKIYAMNNHKTALVYFRIKKESLEHYYVAERFLAGINIITFFKQLKSGQSDDILLLNIDSRCSDTVNITYSSEFRESVSRYSLMNVDEEDHYNQKYEYSSNIKVRANILQTTIKDLSQITKNIEIKNIGHQLIFSTYDSDQSDHSISKDITIKLEQDSISGDIDEDDITQGVFDIELIVRFVKATTINPNGFVKMYLKNDAPLILEYDISSLGLLRFMIFQKNQD